MKLLQHLFVWMAVLAMTIVISCQREVSDELGNPSSGTAGWQFKEDTALFEGPVDTAYITSVSGVAVLSVEGTSEDGNDQFYLQVLGTSIVAGTYASPMSYLEYYSGGNLVYSNDPLTPNKFTVTISRIDSVSVTGTFSGEVKNASGAIKNIKEGKFTGKFKKDTTTTPVKTGQVTFWTQMGCSGTKLLVKVNGQTDTITTYHTTAPACQAAGTAYFTLPEGTYEYKAVCQGTTDTLIGYVAIVANSCATEELVMGGVVNPTSCKYSNIGYFDIASGIGFFSQISTFNASNQVTNTKLMDSTTSPASVYKQFAVTNTSSRVSISSTQYFDIGPGGLVTKFHGNIDPTVDTSTLVEWTYSYDGNGYMVKASLALASSPSVAQYEITNTWINGNMVQIKVTELASGAYDLMVYTYDNTKIGKNMLYPGAYNYELQLFQNAVNWGKNVTNLPTKLTLTSYNAGGVQQGTASVAEYKNYTLDANGNVKSVEVTGEYLAYMPDVRYVLSYKCF